MIAKKFKLKEKELKKVLHRGKPFFSHTMVMNHLPNRSGYNRFGIVLSGKSIQNAVQRNFFRRLFYKEIESLNEGASGAFSDLVLVVKKQTKLDMKDEKNVAKFQKDIHFLLQKVFNNH